MTASSLTLSAVGGVPSPRSPNVSESGRVISNAPVPLDARFLRLFAPLLLALIFLLAPAASAQAPAPAPASEPFRLNIGLEGANKQYHTRILICEATRRLAGDTIEAREIDAIRVVGKSEPVRVYELLGAAGEISPEMTELRLHYEQGLAFYRAGQWAPAMDAFERCLKLRPDDGPAQLFVERVRLLAERTPAAPWDGVWTFTQK